MMIEELLYEQPNPDSGRSVVIGVIVGLAVGATLAVLLTPAGGRRLRAWASKGAVLARRRDEEMAGAATAPAGAITRAYYREVASLTAHGVADLAVAALRAAGRQANGAAAGARHHLRNAVAAGKEAARQAQQEARARYEREVKPGGRRKG